MKFTFVKIRVRMRHYFFILCFIQFASATARSAGIAEKRHLTLAPELHDGCGKCALGEKDALARADLYRTVVLEDVDYTDVDQPIRGLEDPFIDGFVKSFLLRTDLLLGDAKLKANARARFSATLTNYPFLNADWRTATSTAKGSVRDLMSAIARGESTLTFADDDFAGVAAVTVHLFLTRAETAEYRAKYHLPDLAVARAFEKAPRSEALYGQFMEIFAVALRDRIFAENLVKIMRGIDPGITRVTARFGVEHLPGTYAEILREAKRVGLDLRIEVDPDYLSHDHREAYARFGPRLKNKINKLEDFIRDFPRNR